MLNRSRQRRMRRPYVEALELRRLMAADFVINEFLALNKDGLQDADGDSSDWIEILNRGNDSGSLAGYSLTDDGTDLQKWELPAVELPAGETLLVFASGKNRRDVDAELHANFKLSGDGELLALVRPDGATIDFSYAPTYPVQSVDVSYGIGSDGMSLGYFPQPTPKVASNGEPQAAVVSNVLISEIMYHTPSGASDEEYLELYNVGDVMVDLAGWQFSRGVRFTFPSYQLAPHSYVIVAANSNTFLATYGPHSNLVGGWTGGLSNSGETLELLDDRGAVADRVRYADEGDWALRVRGPEDSHHFGWDWSNAHDGGGYSLELVNAQLSNESGQNWAASVSLGGSPGQVNGRAATNVAPLILDVSHDPPVPRSSDATVVRATLVDEQAIGSQLTLHWRVDGSSTFQTVAMHDDGVNGDRRAGDGQYSHLIPPQSDLAIVEFYVTSQDASGLSRAYPNVDAAAGQAANLLFQVDNTFADEIAASVADPTDVQPVFRLIMTEAERAELAQIGDSADSGSNAQMNGTFVRHDGTTVDFRYNVGIRNRGKGSRPRPPNNYRVNFAHDAAWNGVNAINLNSKQTYGQVIGSALFQRAGMVAGNATAVQVRVNGQDLSSGAPSMYGAYNYLEVIDSDFASLHFPNDSNGNVYTVRWDGRVQGDLRDEGSDPDAYRDRYSKNTNVAEDDWSDFLQLVDVLNNAPEATFLEDVERIIDVDQWLTFLAFDTLLTNREASLSRGTGDDYDLYRGINDPRFVIIPHDMDSILGTTDPAVDYSIWLPANVDGLTRLLTHPDVAPRYYQKLLDLMRDVYNPSVAGALVDQFLGGWVSTETVARMKQFIIDRAANVLSQIPQSLTITTDLSGNNGLSTTSAGTVAVHGLAPVAQTRRVEVNGVAAGYDLQNGQWSISSGHLSLSTGLNRLTVRAFDSQSEVVSETSLDVWRDSGAQQTVSGSIGGTSLWTADRRWVVSGNVTVPVGAMLTIEPGAIVTVANGASIQVQGQLVAVGNSLRPIRFTRTTSSGAWNGLAFVNTQQPNQLSYVDLAYSDGSGQSIDVDHSRAVLDHIQWFGTTRTALEVSHPSLIVTNSQLPSIIDNETVHGSGLSGAEYFILKNNVFGTTTGYSDVIDFTGGQRPGPILQVIDNVFLGGSDDGLDLDGTDAYIAGNLFQNFHKNNTSDSSSNAIATGVDSGNASELIIVGNTFFNVDHALLLKERSSAAFENNTVVGATIAAINFDEPNRDVDPGLAIEIRGSVFWRNAETLSNIGSDPTIGVPEIRITNSLLPSEFHTFGDDNLDGDPSLHGVRAFESGEFLTDAVGSAAKLFAIADDSPARGSGPYGIDMGARVTLAARISGTPDALTLQSSATLSVGGPDISHYRYRVVGTTAGDFSVEIPVERPITISGLLPGTYFVEVLGMNSSGVWQDIASPSRSPAWTVTNNPNALSIRLNELQAAGTRDLIELYNPTAVRVNLAGMSLTDDVANPQRFVFPADSWIEPQGYYVLAATAEVDSEGLVQTGFGLSQSGDGLYLFAASSGGSGLLDQVEFGLQVPEYSIGRIGRDVNWKLTQPTFGAANQAQQLASARSLQISEWFTSGDIRLVEDFVEVHNRDSLPVDLSGLSLSDTTVSWTDRSKLPPLSFLSAGDYQAFIADGQAGRGADHLNFRLSSNTAQLGLFDVAGQPIDIVLYEPQQTDISEGRVGDNDTAITRFDLPTPGLANGESAQSVTTTSTLVPFGTDWRYRVDGVDLGAAWREPAYDDQTWLNGAAPLGVETSALPIPLATNLRLGPNTFYFRTFFHYDASHSQSDRVQVSLETMIDDGAVVYLNGIEVHRENMPTGTISYGTSAVSALGNASLAGSFEIPAELLRNGTNILAVEVHQSGSNSSDIVFAAQLVESTTSHVETGTTNDARLLDGLRVTEIMYHPANSAEPEFVELQNLGSETLDLSGVRLADGIDFVFPALQLAAGDFVVATNDAVAFTARYGLGARVAGEFTGSLANQGESLVVLLAEPQSVAISRFAFDDAVDTGWPAAADGQGSSLEVVDVNGDYRDPRNWRASQVAGGTPGYDSTSGNPGDVNDDGVVNASDIDRLFAAIAAQDTSVKFDLNHDDALNARDVDYLVHTTLNTEYGDADLNGRVDFTDFVVLANHFGQAGTWQQGDFDGNGTIEFADFVALANHFGFVRQPIAASPSLADLAASILDDDDRL